MERYFKKFARDDRPKKKNELWGIAGSLLPYLIDHKGQGTYFS